MNSVEAPGTVRSGSRWLLVIVGSALVLSVLLSSTLSTLTMRGVITDPSLQQALGYLVFWGPFVVASVLVYRRGAGIALKFQWIDLLWGLAVGFLARAVSTGVDIAVYGRMGTTFLGSPFDSGAGSTAIFVVTMVVVPVALGPVIEEVFFRGAVLGVLSKGVSAGSTTGRSTAGLVIAVVASAAVFALMHVLNAGSPSAALANGIGTFVFGVGAGVLAVTTNRLGGAIVAHVVFNGSVILLALAG